MASGTLLNRLMAVRHASEDLIKPLDIEDLNLQGWLMPVHPDGTWPTPPGSSKPLCCSLPAQL